MSATALLRRHASRRADTAWRALDGRLGLRARPHRRPPGQAVSVEFVMLYHCVSVNTRRGDSSPSDFLGRHTCRGR